MRLFGLLFILLGITILLYISFTYFREKDVVVTPLPEEKGVKVIIVTPTK
jgi:hypothetical protein